MKVVVYVLAALTFAGSSLQAQGSYLAKSSRQLNYTELSFYSGFTNYIGELNDYSSLHQLLNTRWNVGAIYYKPILRRFGLSVGLDFTQISGDDYYSSNLLSYARNLHFQSSMLGAEAGLNYDVFPHSPFRQKKGKGLRLTAGIGVARFRTSTITAAGERVILNNVGTEGQVEQSAPNRNAANTDPYSDYFVYIPMGVTYSHKLNKRMAIGISIKYNLTFIDYIDDVSEFFFNPLLLKEDLAIELSNRTMELVHARTGNDRVGKFEELLVKEGSAFGYLDYLNQPNAIGTGQRGNPDNNDSYFSVSINLIYRIPNKIKCFK